MNYCKIFLYIYCYLHLFKANLDMFTRNGALLIFVNLNCFSPILGRGWDNFVWAVCPKVHGFFFCVFMFVSMCHHLILIQKDILCYIHSLKCLLINMKQSRMEHFQLRTFKSWKTFTVLFLCLLLLPMNQNLLF